MCKMVVVHHLPFEEPQKAKQPTSELTFLSISCFPMGCCSVNNMNWCSWNF